MPLHVKCLSHEGNPRRSERETPVPSCEVRRSMWLNTLQEQSSPLNENPGSRPKGFLPAELAMVACIPLSWPSAHTADKMGSTVRTKWLHRGPAH